MCKKFMNVLLWIALFCLSHESVMAAWQVTARDYSPGPAYVINDHPASGPGQNGGWIDCRDNYAQTQLFWVHAYSDTTALPSVKTFVSSVNPAVANNLSTHFPGKYFVINWIPEFVIPDNPESGWKKPTSFKLTVNYGEELLLGVHGWSQGNRGAITRVGAIALCQSGMHICRSSSDLTWIKNSSKTKLLYAQLSTDYIMNYDYVPYMASYFFGTELGVPFNQPINTTQNNTFFSLICPLNSYICDGTLSHENNNEPVIIQNTFTIDSKDWFASNLLTNIQSNWDPYTIDPQSVPAMMVGLELYGEVKAECEPKAGPYTPEIEAMASLRLGTLGVTTQITEY